MKTTILPVLVMLVLLAGCTGVTIRDEVLFPMAGQIYEYVYPQIVIGLDDAVKDGDLSQEQALHLLAEADRFRMILKSGSRNDIITFDWKSLEPWAARGVQELVDDGTISPAAATSLFQRIVNFRDLLVTLSGKLVVSKTRPTWNTDTLVGKRSIYTGQTPRLDMNWTPLDKHNKPRRALGVREVTYEEIFSDN